MPGWFIHMDVARKAIASLSKNEGISALLSSSSNGLSATELMAIAQDDDTAAYLALGAIGPDIFFILPDFGPGVKQNLWFASQTIKNFYDTFDDIFIGPYTDSFAAIDQNSTDLNNAFGGGFPQQITEITNRTKQFLRDTELILLSRQVDLFSFLGSGVPKGWDEQAFFWSDMLHYRKTYEFAAKLWKNAGENKRLQAFAIGWMTHLATDVTGHAFVNEKSGGPYRLHWQRHHLVENHMDAKVYDSENGQNSLYQMLSCSALHLWIAFNKDGSSFMNFTDLNDQRPTYLDGDDSASVLDRRKHWDIDSSIPDGVKTLLANTLKDVYNPISTNSTPVSGNGQCFDHPLNIANIVTGSDGYPQPDDIDDTYFYLYHYVKLTTTDYFKMKRPPPPSASSDLTFPLPPGTGSSDPGPDFSNDDILHNIFEILFEIIAWIEYGIQVLEYYLAKDWANWVFPQTYTARQFLYETVELPIYNAWAALHWYLSMTGFVVPMKDEINPAMTTLGIGTENVWQSILDAIGDPAGGLSSVFSGGSSGIITIPPLEREPSGSDVDQAYPHDVILDPISAINASHIDPLDPNSSSFDPTGTFTQIIQNLLPGQCKNVGPGSEIPSEFLRPWKWPSVDNTGDAVPSELPKVQASPYKSMQDVIDTVMGGVGGNLQARMDFENATKESDTVDCINKHLPHGEYLGDPIDYAGYVIANLTRNDLNFEKLTNFDLDSDRGYGYLCWDWVRSKDIKATPTGYSGQPNPCQYHAPLRPGAGWCDTEIPTGTVLPPTGSTSRPTTHEDNPSTPVRIRYIDKEPKFI